MLIKEMKMIFKCRGKMRETPSSIPYSINDIVKAFNEHYKEEKKKHSPSELVFSAFPHLRQVEGFADFIDNQDHIKFEKADLRNDKDVFEEMIMKGKLNCMMIHMKNTCFEWTYWKNYLITTGLCDIVMEQQDMREKVCMNKLYTWADTNIDDFF